MLDILNLQPNKISTDLRSYNFLFYGIPSTGKTTFAVELFPKHLILGFEVGYKGIPNAVGVPVPNYIEFLNYVNKLDTDEARAIYDTLIIDTTTKVGEAIETYILSMYGKDSLGDAKSHGGAYPLINRYYNNAFDRLKSRGYNFVYICHAKSEDIKNDKDEVLYKKYSPKMSDRISGLIEPEVDYTFYFITNKDNKLKIVTDRTIKNVGKQRTDLPLILDLDAELFKKEFVNGVNKKGGDAVTEEKVHTTVVQAKKKERDYQIVVEEIKTIGKALTETGKGKDAVKILNARLSTDNNGNQRTLEMMSQKNIELLEAIVFDLKELETK